MPNHIKNRVTIIANNETIKAIKERYSTFYPAKLRLSYDGKIICENKKDKSFGWFDPKTATFTQRGKEDLFGLPDDFAFEIEKEFIHLPDFSKIVTPPNDDAYKDLPNQRIAGSSPNWWRTWNIKNWGSKWNSYSCEQENYESFTFETAWNGVPELMQKISEQNKGIEFLYEFSDEDTGYNCGFYRFLDGNVIENKEFEGGSKEAYELAFSLRPDSKKYYRLVDDRYIYTDED